MVYLYVTLCYIHMCVYNHCTEKIKIELMNVYGIEEISYVDISDIADGVD
jgi:hypothetical protein